jgi:hypothetical protein
MAKSRAALSAPVWPPEMIFLTIALRLVLSLNLLQFGEKFLLGKESLFNHQLHSGINLDGIRNKEFFEGDQFIWVKWSGH